jgi:hypothetical protein
MFVNVPLQASFSENIHWLSPVLDVDVLAYVHRSISVPSLYFNVELVLPNLSYYQINDGLFD